MTYTQAAAGGLHTVLLRSDGTAVACGDNYDGRCDLPALEPGTTYTEQAGNKTVLQATLDGDTLRMSTLGGRVVCSISARSTDCLAGIHLRLRSQMRESQWPTPFDVVMPGG